MLKKITLGLDVGGTLIKAISLEGDEAPTKSYECPSGAQSGPSAVRTAIASVVSYYREAGLTPEFIGIGCAGSV